VPPDPLAVFKGPTSKEREMKKRRGKGRGGKGGGERTPSQIPGQPLPGSALDYMYCPSLLTGGDR